MVRIHFLGNTLSSVGNAANETAYVAREVKESLTKLIKPLVCVVWGIVGLIYLDVYNNVSNSDGATVYSFCIGKVLLEAFFYALFFALWGDIFNEYPLRSRLRFINDSYKKIQTLDLTQDSILMPVFFGSSCLIIAIWAPFWICIIHGAMSGIVYQKVNKSIILRPNDYTIEGNHLYRKKEDKGETVDAIINWDYTPKDTKQIMKYKEETTSKKEWVFI